MTSIGDCMIGQSAIILHREFIKVSSRPIITPVKNNEQYVKDSKESYRFDW